MLRTAWLRTPLVPVAVAVGAGIALGWALPPLWWWAIWLGAVGAALIVLASRRHAWTTAPVLVAAMAVGALRVVPAPLAPDHVAHLALPRTGPAEGRILREPVRAAADRHRLVLELDQLDGAPRSGRVQITVHGDSPPLAEGQRIVLDTRLRAPTAFRNPHGFDYAAFLARDGIHVVGTAAADGVRVLDESTPWHVRVRRGALAAIERALPPVSGALLGGLLLGARGELPRETLDDFRRAGVYHVLAVSGFNVALVASAAFATMLLVRASRRVAAAVALAVVIAFACVVGPEPSVLRATIMAALVLVALLLERDAFVVNSLALAAVAILAVHPEDLADPGFQLSFAATAGIVLAPLPRSPVAGALAVSVAAQLAVLPITLSHFNQVSTIGVLANLGVVPLAGLATLIGLVAVGLSVAGDWLAAPLFDAMWPVLLLLRAIVTLAASVPGALVHLPAPPSGAVAGYVTALGLGVIAWRQRESRPSVSRACGALAFCLLLAACAIEAWPIVRPGDGRLRVTVLDVGQGDAIVIEGPDRRTLLVDAGPGGANRLDTGERVVAPYLWNRGVRRLAGVITTHGDVDHAGGMAAIRRLFGVDAELGVPRDGGPQWLGPVAVSVWRAEATGARGRNDDALVVRLDYVTASFLLASDIGPLAERALIERGPGLGAAVLKVAHHGARRSTTPEFLRAVRPAVAVISVGSRNAYGHPDPDTVARLEAAGARVYRTDRDGAVILETDGRVLDVMRWAERRVHRYCLDPDTSC